MHKQKGMTMVSWIVVISFLGVVAVSALNIIPSYLGFFSARSILETLKDDSIIKGKTASQIKTVINERFRFNNIRNVDATKAITFKNKGTSDGSGYTIMLKYEDRGKIMGNLYFVTVFSHEVEINP
ncbi:MAG: DUF4845 domain-containing protein [Gammaproteobacteria bacterium]|nr:DUF4845 domain-containing protein [Gammaproteobacteria bacterium]